MLGEDIIISHARFLARSVAALLRAPLCGLFFAHSGMSLSLSCFLLLALNNLR